MRTVRYLPKIKCEGSDTGKCKNPAVHRANGLNVCGVHKRSIERTFAQAEQRWLDAGEPESDL